MHPREITIALSPDDATVLIGEQAAQIRGLQIVVSKYIDAHGVLPEFGGPMVPMADEPLDEAKYEMPPELAAALDEQAMASFLEADAALEAGG